MELEKHAMITAEDLLIESYVDNVPRKTWGNYQEYLAIYGEDRPIRELPLPRIKFTRQLPAILRLQLLQESEAPAERELSVMT